MKRFYLASHHEIYTLKELSELSGIAQATLRDRLRRGYSVEQAIKPKAVHDSVEEFNYHNTWQDWLGMPISDLHKIYWAWCLKNDYEPIQVQGFSRQLMSLNPQLKTVPNRFGKAGNCTYKRVIRMREDIANGC